MLNVWITRPPHNTSQHNTEVGDIMENMPQEILLLVCMHLNVKDLISVLRGTLLLTLIDRVLFIHFLCVVNKKWSSVARDRAVWADSRALQLTRVSISPFNTNHQHTINYTKQPPDFGVNKQQKKEHNSTFSLFRD